MQKGLYCFFFFVFCISLGILCVLPVGMYSSCCICHGCRKILIEDFSRKGAKAQREEFKRRGHLVLSFLRACRVKADPRFPNEKKQIAMTTLEHAMLGINGVLATGLQRRFGWQLVAMAGGVSVAPDWDGLTILGGETTAVGTSRSLDRQTV